MMARFSKQYCERYHPEFSWDFDILREAADLKEGEYQIKVCEGFMSYGYGKFDGQICLAFADLEVSGTMCWVALEDVTDKTHLELFPYTLHPAYEPNSK
jgi:hypothetical protein